MSSVTKNVEAGNRYDYYLGDSIPDINDNRLQALKIADKLGYDSMKLFETTSCIKKEFEEIMKKHINIPNINFNRNLANSGFTIHSWTKYSNVSNITANNILNPIAHTGYLPWKNEPSWHMRFINLEDFDYIFHSN